MIFSDEDTEAMIGMPWNQFLPLLELASHLIEPKVLQNTLIKDIPNLVNKEFSN